VEIDATTEQVAEGFAVTVHVRLSPRETSRLFLSGDTLILLPTEGIVVVAEAAPIPRTSIFLSEIAGGASGLRRTFVDRPTAEQFAADVRTQLEKALEEL
jgi:hypothetical protein